MTMHDVETRPLPDRVVNYGPSPTAAREIVRPFEPVAWVYARLSIEGESERALQCRHIADVLEREGAPGPAIGALHSRLIHAAVAPLTLALYARPDGSIVHEQRLPDTEVDDRIGYTLPPDVIALLERDQSRPPFVHVVIDRTGADLTSSTGGSAIERHSVVVGQDDEIERNAPGGRSGWSQSRYQRRAEDSWKHNAHQVADELAVATARVGAQAIVLSGDVRAVQLLEERLPDDPTVFVRHLTGSRSADGSQAVRASRLNATLSEIAHAQNQHLLQVFQSYLGPAGHAVQGADATIAALAAGRVATLLVTPNAVAREVWFGAAGTEVYRDHATALLGERSIHAGPLVHVAVRAALLSGASVRILPADGEVAPAEGIGALCRFGD
jgi:hypothetical protein